MSDDDDLDLDDEEEDNPLILSFADLLSGSLAAGVLLFMVFAIMPHLGNIVTRNMAACVGDGCLARAGQGPIELGNERVTLTDHVLVFLQIDVLCAGDAICASTTPPVRWRWTADGVQSNLKSDPPNDCRVVSFAIADYRQLIALGTSPSATLRPGCSLQGGQLQVGGLTPQSLAPTTHSNFTLDVSTTVPTVKSSP